MKILYFCSECGKLTEHKEIVDLDNNYQVFCLECGKGGMLWRIEKRA